MKWILVLSIFIFVEVISFLVVFKFIGRIYLAPDPQTKSKVDLKDFLKGMFERGVLSFALANNLPQILIFFGAMKLGTRITSKVNSEDFNSFFLVGNLFSVFLSIIYSIHLHQESDFIVWLQLKFDIMLNCITML